MPKKKEGKIITCQACCKEFYVPKHRIETAKYCSVECNNHLKYTKQVKECKACKKEYTVSESRKDKKFCSRECVNKEAMDVKERRKRNNSLFILKRGTDSTRSLKKHISRVRELFCDNCGYDKASYNIEIHHIDENPTNNVIENLAVLCVMCHRDLHYGDLEYKNGEYFKDIK
jgi:hypothetical protein